jgi:hypothetical protein
LPRLRLVLPSEMISQDVLRRLIPPPPKHGTTTIVRSFPRSLPLRSGPSGCPNSSRAAASTSVSVTPSRGGCCRGWKRWLESNDCGCTSPQSAVTMPRGPARSPPTAPEPCQREDSTRTPGRKKRFRSCLALARQTEARDAGAATGRGRWHQLSRRVRDWSHAGKGPQPDTMRPDRWRANERGRNHGARSQVRPVLPTSMNGHHDSSQTAGMSGDWWRKDAGVRRQKMESPFDRTSCKLSRSCRVSRIARQFGTV